MKLSDFIEGKEYVLPDQRNQLVKSVVTKVNLEEGWMFTKPLEGDPHSNKLWQHDLDRLQADFDRRQASQKPVPVEMTRDDVMRETAAHVRRVGDLLAACIAELTKRAIHHDESKFSAEEFPAFAEETPRLRGLTYGSPEYQAALARLDPALLHHYENNSHHPQFYGRGVYGMDLLDLVEMLCDWKAAGERHADGSLAKSFEVNRRRFNIPHDLEQVMKNTAKRLGW